MEIIETISIGLLCACFLMPVICNVLYMMKSEEASEVLIKVSLVLKLIHIPSYVIIFIFGFIAGLMFFMTFPLIILLMIFDYITLMFSSTISVLALAKNIKNNTVLSIIALICQFIFCADVISLFVLYFITRKDTQTHRALSAENE